ncbi:MAG: MFS transporter [Gemmatimonadota bacterium]|nr:MFS transporter [Gemmatimonadota bacterium]
MSRDRAPAVPGTVKGLALVSLFNDFASEMVYPLLPAFVTLTLGAGAGALAALDGAADLAAAATKWWSGSRADRPGWRKPLILAGYFSAILIRPVIGVASAAWQVIGFRVLDRIGKGLRTPARDAMIADATLPEHRGRAFGLHRAADHFGSIPGALIAWWLLQHQVDVRRVLTLSILPGMVAGLVLLVVLRRADGPSVRRSVGPAGESPNRPIAGPDATGRIFWVPVFALALLVLLRLPETLLLLRLQDLGVPVATIPLVWAGLHAVRSVVSYPGGWLTDHLGPRGAVAAGGVAFSAGIAALGSALGPVAAITVFLALGLVAGLTESAERVVVARLAPRRTGRGFGAYHALTGLAALPAALGFGFLYQLQGGSMALWASAGGMLVASGWWLLAARPVLPAPRSEG